MLLKEFLEVRQVSEEDTKWKPDTDVPGVMHDIQMISEELESLYHHYSTRIKNVSEELSRERSKHKVYQLEIAENHHTIQMLTEQIEYLLQEVEVRHELYIQLQQNVKKEPLNGEARKNNEMTLQEEFREEVTGDDNSWEVTDHLLPESIPEIRVIYESIQSDMKILLEQIKNRAISLLIETNEYYLSEKKKAIEVEMYHNDFITQLEWLQVHRKQYMGRNKERWYTKVWNFLWGKEEGNNHPEILKKLDLIEEQLLSYSAKFNEVKETLNKSTEREETTQSYIQKMGALHDEIKKIEGFYEDELHSLKNQLEDFKQREKDLERQISLLNEKYSGEHKEKSQREVELEQELNRLRKDLQSQSNKKNELYNKMKQQKKQAPQVNPQFDEYGHIPMASEAKRTMFNPNKYIR
jgi:chromosome segregation ATPase